MGATKMLKKLRIFLEYLKRPMPLNDFEDYDDYWDKRGFNVHIKEHYWCNYLGFEVVNYRVSSTIIVLGVDWGKLYPSLFAKQIIYEILNYKKS